MNCHTVSNLYTLKVCVLKPMVFLFSVKNCAKEEMADSIPGPIDLIAEWKY